MFWISIKYYASNGVLGSLHGNICTCVYVSEGNGQYDEDAAYEEQEAYEDAAGVNADGEPLEEEMQATVQGSTVSHYPGISVFRFSPDFRYFAMGKIPEIR